MLDLNKIKIIIRKEWLEVFKNRMVFFTVLFMPLLFTALPLIILSTMSGSGGGEMASELPPQFSQLCPQDVSGGECMQIYIASQFTILFMMVPLITPINIAAYSIVGEKTTRSLEPLLATPITTAELLIAKNLAAVIPAVLSTWIGYAIYVLGAGLITTPGVMRGLFAPHWFAAVLLLGPLLSILSVNFSMIVSSRVNDPRVAEQISTVVILPVLGLFFGQISGLFYFNQVLVWITSAILLVLDLGVILAAVSIFRRESILTRWK